jgi:hypothetical protein
VSRHNSYPAPGFAAVYKGWSPRQQTVYRNKIEQSLEGGPLTQEAHEMAIAQVSGPNSPGKRLASMMREAMEHPGEFKF